MPLSSSQYKEIELAYQRLKNNEPQKYWSIDNGEVKQSVFTRNKEWLTNIWNYHVRVQLLYGVLSFTNGISKNMESIVANMPFGISSNCERLANKVLSASADKAAEEGGQLTSYGELELISKTNKSIICRGYFKGNGVWRSDDYTISEDNNGVYWRTPGRIEYQFQQEIHIPEQQIEFQIQDVQ